MEYFLFSFWGWTVKKLLEFCLSLHCGQTAKSNSETTKTLRDAVCGGGSLRTLDMGESDQDFACSRPKQTNKNSGRVSGPGWSWYSGERVFNMMFYFCFQNLRHISDLF